MNAVAEQGLIHQSSGNGSQAGMSVYDRVDPFKFIDDMGRIFGMTGAGGADTIEKGKLLALACLSRRMDIFQLSGTYHLIGGKLSMKADVMLAKFRQAGGKHQWIKDGSDGQTASAVFTFEGQSHTVSYSIEDAKRAGLLSDPNKKPGNWEKNPAAMLRARVVSSGVRMLAPEVLEGSYCPEELEGDDQPVVATVVTSNAPSAAAVVGVDAASNATEAEKTKRKRRTAAEIAADNAAELAAKNQQVNNQPGTGEQAGDVIDVTPEMAVAQAPVAAAAAAASTAQPAATASVFDPKAPGSILPATLTIIDGLAAKLGANREQLEAHLRNGNPGFTTFTALSEESAQVVVANLEAVASPKK